MNALRIAVAAAVLCAGCASIEKERGHDEVARLVDGRLGAETGWAQGGPTAEAISERVGQLLDGGLTPERAVHIALINSPDLQETYEELGIGQADVLQAGLLPNPELDLSIGGPKLPGFVLEHEVGLVQAFVDLLMLPERKRVAEDQFAADTLRVAHQALATAAEAKQALLDVQTAEALLAAQRQLLATEELAADLSRRQHEAGNITELDWAQRSAAFEQARVNLSQTEFSLLGRREALNRVLGLWGPRTGWTLAERLPEPPAQGRQFEHLESLAIRQRLDLQAARKRTLLLFNALELARTWRFFGRIDVGIHEHQDPDGARLFGPTLTLELPIFDQRQAVIGRLEAEQRQSERRLAALSVHTRSEVREAEARLKLAHQLTQHLKTRVLPLRARVVEQTLLQYNGMQVGLYDLLEAKHAELESLRDYLEARREYGSALIDLERLVGGRLPISNPSAASRP